MLNFRAISRGFLVDITTTCLFAAALSILLVDPGSSAFSPIERLQHTSFIDWSCLIGGLAMTVLGGFVCGRMAPGREITHTSALGCLSLLASILLGGQEMSNMDWYTFVGLTFTVPAAQFGGVIAGLSRVWDRSTTISYLT